MTLFLILVDYAQDISESFSPVYSHGIVEVSKKVSSTMISISLLSQKVNIPLDTVLPSVIPLLPYTKSDNLL